MKVDLLRIKTIVKIGEKTIYSVILSDYFLRIELLRLKTDMGVTKIDQYVINKVREKRKAANISQAALAHLLDVSEGFIGNIESTKYSDKYSVAHLNELAKILKCSPKDFLPDKPL